MGFDAGSYWERYLPDGGDRGGVIALRAEFDPAISGRDDQGAAGCQNGAGDYAQAIAECAPSRQSQQLRGHHRSADAEQARDIFRRARRRAHAEAQMLGANRQAEPPIAMDDPASSHDPSGGSSGPLVDVCMLVNGAVRTPAGETNCCIFAAAVVRDVLRVKNRPADVLRVEAAVYPDDVRRNVVILAGMPTAFAGQPRHRTIGMATSWRP